MPTNPRRSLMTMEPRNPESQSRYDLSEEERQGIIERARRELPELDREFEEAQENLRRIGSGLPPLAKRGSEAG